MSLHFSADLTFSFLIYMFLFGLALPLATLVSLIGKIYMGEAIRYRNPRACFRYPLLLFLSLSKSKDCLKLEKA